MYATMNALFRDFYLRKMHHSAIFIGRKCTIPRFLGVPQCLYVGRRPLDMKFMSFLFVSASMAMIYAVASTAVAGFHEATTRSR